MRVLGCTLRQARPEDDALAAPMETGKERLEHCFWFLGPSPGKRNSGFSKLLWGETPGQEEVKGCS